MSSGAASSSAERDHPLLPWRWVAGASLHVALPLYLLAGLIAGLVAVLHGSAAAELVPRAVPFSLWFAVVYPAAAAILTLAAMLFDPPLRRRRRRRLERHPDAAAEASRRRVADALAAGRRVFDPPAFAVLDTIASAVWDHADPPFQALSADLAAMMRTSLTAIGTAPAGRRQELMSVAAAALARIAARLRELEDDRRRLDEGDMLTVATYIDSRYAADSAGDSTG